MAAGPWLFTNTTRTKILNGQFVISSGSYKVALVTSASNISAASTTWAGVTGEVGTTNTGYATGGIAVSPLVLAGTTSVTTKFGTNPVWTAGTANLVAHWAVLYEVGGDVVAYCLLDSGGADVTTTSGNTLTIDSITNPLLTLA
jgi:hypothetical protein